MPDELTQLAVVETSGVDHPAHLHEGWLVLKSGSTHQESTDMPETKPAEPTAEDIAALTKAIEDASTAAATAAVEQFKADLTAMGEAETEPTEDDLMKSLPEPVRDMLAKARDDAEAARADAKANGEALAKALNEQADERAIAKAASTYGALTEIDAKVVGPALRKLRDADTDLADTVEKALTAANGQVESAELFKELGKPGLPSADSPAGQLEAIAKSKLDAGECKTLAEARVAAATENPDLYNTRQEG